MTKHTKINVAKEPKHMATKITLRFQLPLNPYSVSLVKRAKVRIRLKNRPNQ